MDEILNETVTDSDLKKFEKNYNREKSEGNITFGTQFEYAWCLVRSNYSSDMKSGITLLEDLCIRHPDGKRDYIYYLAIGYTRLKQYSTAQKYVNAFLEIEPNNQQVIGLEEHIKKQIDRDMIKGAAYGAGAALVVGGILSIAFGLSKK
uniref:Mitochondrial fission 1 protein n=1 Tax=Corethrella appendiculata TaxID=1370023 RepID=U5ETL5_9DIPT